MKVSIVQGGGMVPIVTTTAADSASLSAEDAEKLRAMVDGAGLQGLSSSREAPQPDRPRYQITIEDEGTHHQVTLDDAALPDAVRTLLSWIGSVPGHEESIGPIGGG